MFADFLKNHARVNEVLTQSPSRLSSASLTNLALWQDFFEFEWREIQGCGCVWVHSGKSSFVYWPPRGNKMSVAVVAEVFAQLKKENGDRPVARVENVPQEDLNFFPEADYRYFSKGDEFIYERAAIAELRGNAYKTKRNAYNQFVKNNSFEFLPFGVDDGPACLQLYDRWAKEKEEKNNDDAYRFMLQDSRVVLERAIKDFTKLDLVWRVVKIQGKIRAFTFGYPLTTDTFCDYFEIADLSIKGLAAYIFSALCQDEALKSFRYVNVMDDFGMPHVGVTKESFRPVKKLPVYVVTKKD